MAKFGPKKDKPKKEKISREEKKQLKKLEKERQKQQQKKDNILKKEAEEREQQRIANENKPLTWIYAGEADITIGETKVSNVAKVILFLLLAGLIVAGVVGFLNRNLVVDYITKPAIVLTDKEIDLEVGKPFDYKEYLAEQEYPDRYKITLPKNSDVDTTKIGTYDVKYKLKSSAGTRVTDLKVNVVDTTPPTLTLKDDMIKLTRGNETKKFNPKKYIKDYSDNYDSKENLIVTNTEKFDWSKDKVEVTYSVKDSSNNITTKKLLISVNEPVKETQPANNNNSGSSENSSSNSSGSSSGNSSGNSSGGSSGGSSGNSSGGSSGNSSGGSSGGSSSSPYISGVHSVSVPVGSDFSSMVNKLVSGVHGSGYVSCDYSGVNLTSPGTYRVTFSSDDGVTKTTTVTVY